MVKNGKKNKWLKLIVPVTLDLIFGTCTCMLKFLPISPVKHWYNIMFRFYFTWDFNMCVTVFTLQMMTGNK